jgi:hypothetical protein
MHRQRFGIVVYRNVDRPTESGLQPRGGSPAAGEVVHDQLVAEIQGLGEVVASHVASKKGSGDPMGQYIAPKYNLQTVSKRK